MSAGGKTQELLNIVILEEFQLSGIEVELFSKEGRGLFTGRAVQILDIHKLRDEMGEKTVAVEAFEGNNLVLVDEGHRGTSGAEIGAWMQKRNQLCENGFSFEYSATFGQAMKASGNRALEQTYAKCILFDYSYKYFYGDGYGKDYRILNLADDSDENIRRKYLTACLLPAVFDRAAALDLRRRQRQRGPHAEPAEGLRRRGHPSLPGDFRAGARQERHSYRAAALRARGPA
jgi:hypothetical protein